MSAYSAASGEYPIVVPNVSHRRRDTTQPRSAYLPLWIITCVCGAVVLVAALSFVFSAILGASWIVLAALLVVIIAGLASGMITIAAAKATSIACQHIDRRATALAADLAQQAPRYAALAAIPGDVRAQVQKLHRMYARELERLEQVVVQRVEVVERRVVELDPQQQAAPGSTEEPYDDRYLSGYADGLAGRMLGDGNVVSINSNGRSPTSRRGA